jgi:putative membrane protein
MKQYLNDQERIKLDQRIAEAEKRTGAQIVLAVIERSDSYVELPWKAFALGAAGGGLVAAWFGFFQPGWQSGGAVLTAVASTLFTGAVFTLLATALPGIARYLLDAHRAESEVLQYAQAFFLDRQLFATRERTGILLLVSMFERQVVLLPDKGLDKRLSREAQRSIVNSMIAVLAEKRVGRALEIGLEALENVLTATGPAASAENELPNAVVEEKGS